MFCLFSFVAVVVFFSQTHWVTLQNSTNLVPRVFWLFGQRGNGRPKSQKTLGTRLKQHLNSMLGTELQDHHNNSIALTNRLFYSPKDITLTPLVAAYENHSCKRPAPIIRTPFSCAEGAHSYVRLPELPLRKLES